MVPGSQGLRPSCEASSEVAEVLAPSGRREPLPLSRPSPFLPRGHAWHQHCLQSSLTAPAASSGPSCSWDNRKRLVSQSATMVWPYEPAVLSQLSTHHLLHRSRPTPHPLTVTDIPEHQHLPFTLSHKAQSSSSAVPHPLLYGGEGMGHSSPFKELKQDSPRGGQLLAQGGANRFGVEPRRRCFFYYRPRPVLCTECAHDAPPQRLAAGATVRSEEEGERTGGTGGQAWRVPRAAGGGKRRGERCACTPAHAQGGARYRPGAKPKDLF